MALPSQTNQNPFLLPSHVYPPPTMHSPKCKPPSRPYPLLSICRLSLSHPHPKPLPSLLLSTVFFLLPSLLFASFSFRFAFPFLPSSFLLPTEPFSSTPKTSSFSSAVYRLLLPSSPTHFVPSDFPFPTQCPINYSFNLFFLRLLRLKHTLISSLTFSFSSFRHPHRVSLSLPPTVFLHTKISFFFLPTVSLIAISISSSLSLTCSAFPLLFFLSSLFCSFFPFSIWLPPPTVFIHTDISFFSLPPVSV